MPYIWTGRNAKLQFLTSAEMPMMIYDAIKKTGHPSITAYLQDAAAEALAKDLGVSVEDIKANLPPRDKTHKVNGKYAKRETADTSDEE